MQDVEDNGGIYMSVKRNSPLRSSLSVPRSFLSVSLNRAL